MVAGVIAADHALWAPQLVGEATDVLITAPSQETADEMFNECKKRFREGPLSLEQYGVTKDNEQTWEFSSGVRILSRTLGNVEQENSAGNRGKNPTCVVVDEAAFERDAVYEEEVEQFFITHETFEYCLFSTPAGRSGYFYQKVEFDDDFYSPHWPTEISPYAQEDYIQEQKEKLDSETFRQEFLGEFLEDGGSAIPHGTLVPNIDPDRAYDTSLPRFIGLDPARGGKDEMVAVDMDASGCVWNIWAFDEIDGPRFVEFLEIVHQHKPPDELEYWAGEPEPEVGDGDTPIDGYEDILIEENGVGGFAADFAEADLGSVIKVVNSTNKKKQSVYQRLVQDLEAEELALPNEKTLTRQATKLEKSFTPTGKAKYEAPPGKHDDWVDALAFSNWVRHGRGESLDVDTGPVKVRRRKGGDKGRRRYIK